jgi:acetyltransferase-like isoleucine patch superfamily enzyme
VHIVAFERVTLGDGAMVGEYSSLRDANHRRSASSVRHSGHEQAPIEVGRNVWIGRGATVLKGLTLGESCVVGANAVVTHSVAAQTVVAGAPARRIDTPDTHAAPSRVDQPAGALALSPFNA